jgi:hypothetical protein
MGGTVAPQRGTVAIDEGGGGPLPRLGVRKIRLILQMASGG